MKKNKWFSTRVIFLGLIFSFLLIFFGHSAYFTEEDYFHIEAEELKVHFIDVGQGDSILIQSPEDKNILIDGGNRWNKVEEKLISYLKKQEVTTLDAVVSTHPHADHIGGLSAVIREFEVEQIYDSGRIHTSKTYENYLLLIDEKDIPFVTPRRGDVLEIGELSFKVLHPDQNKDVNQYSLNNSSLVLQLEFEEISFLFTGDIEKEVQQEIVDTDIDIKANILKVGHHGSETFAHEVFMRRANPEIAVIQAGEDNRYGHPHEETLNLLKEEDIEIFRNDIHGDIIITAAGGEYEIDAGKDKTPRAPPETENTEDESSKLNINQASQHELEQLWGVGPVTAEKIIEYRKEHGSFKSRDEIKKVDGIDEKKFNKWKNEITV
ncbi:MAG: helix-hairpin-helix domain-containing protein [Bacillota bacterium]